MEIHGKEKGKNLLNIKCFTLPRNFCSHKRTTTKSLSGNWNVSNFSIDSEIDHVCFCLDRPGTYA